jgi:branched-chain amino acid transport system permease protein
MIRRLRSPHTLAVAAALLLAAYPLVRPQDAYRHTVLLLAFLLAIQATSWNIISGYAGYVSLGHSMFLGIGAYTAGILAADFGLNPLAVAPLGGVAAVVVATLAGLVLLRTRGHAFVIITIALLFAIQVLAVNLRSVTHGSDGITLPLPPWPSHLQNAPFYYIFLGLLILTVAVSAWVRRTRFGAGLIAIRDDEGKAAAIGVNTIRYKVLAYVFSSFFVGVAGGVYAYFLTFLNPLGAFNILVSVTIVLSALLGGRGTLYGPVLGALVVQVAGEAATVYSGGTHTRVLIFGLALVLVVLFLPAGVLPTVEGWWRRRHPAAVKFLDQSGALGSGRVEVRTRPPSAPAAKIEPLLSVRGVVKRFGGVVAVDQADLAVAGGSITGLIGPNGSGKTTLFNLVTGVVRADRGEVWFDGRRIDRLPAWARCHRGLGRTFQLTRLFPSMSVLENLVAPLPDARWRTLARSGTDGAEADRAHELLGFVGLGAFAAQPASTLSYGQQKLVELAQVLMLEPRLVLLDEPAGGVNPSLVERLMEIVRQLNAQGVTFLIVEHNIPMVLDLCDPVTVFSGGRMIAEGPPAAIRRDRSVLEAYLGEEWLARNGEAPRTDPGRPAPASTPGVV